MYYYKEMTLSASPYAQFKAEDWMIPVKPFVSNQSIQQKERKRSYKKLLRQTKNLTLSNKKVSKKHVQLSFARFF
tara:strand:+ start:3353 stop:3577 length:225 start_codon:yes stop_codon:yes gene_type:complete